MADKMLNGNSLPSTTSFTDVIIKYLPMKFAVIILGNFFVIFR